MKNRNSVMVLAGLLIVCLSAFFAAACANNNETPSKGGDFDALQTKIVWAQDILAGVETSADGTDVDSTMLWVTPTLYDALESAILEAVAMHDGASASQAELDSMVATLDSAGKAVTAAAENGTFSGRTDLTPLINEAVSLLAGAKPAASAADVPRGDDFVLESAHTALTSTLASAQDLMKGSDLHAITAMVTTLGSAITAYKNSQGTGTKAPDISALTAAIGSVAALKAGVEIESDANAIPGLFLDFDVNWVLNSADTAITAAVNTAQAFADTIATTGTQVQATAALAALNGAISDYSNAQKKGLGLVFIDVPAGKFLRYGGGAPLGSTSNQTTISYAYKIGKYDITVGQWEAVMGTAWQGGRYDEEISPTRAALPGADRSRFPATRISWYDAIAFCNKLSTMTGKDTVYTVSGVSDWAALVSTDIPSNHPSGIGSNGGGSANTDWSGATASWTANGYRLPTEHEWQWAAMGANADITAIVDGNGFNTNGYWKGVAGQAANTTTSNGRTYPDRNSYAWLSATNGEKDGTRQVGELLPNELGIYDMSGSVFEWCWDWVDTSGGGNNRDLSVTGAQTDYHGPSAPSTRRKLGHGGDWWNASTPSDNVTADRPSIWDRTGYYEYIGYDQSGMRVVMNAQ